MFKNFWQSVDAILEDVSATETIVSCYTINLKTIIFHYSKNYSNPRRTTRLKVPPNISDPISLNEKFTEALSSYRQILSHSRWSG